MQTLKRLDNAHGKNKEHKLECDNRSRLYRFSARINIPKVECAMFDA